MKKFQIKRLVPEDIPRLMWLYSRVYYTVDNREWRFRAMFNTERFGFPGHIGYLALVGDSIVGFYGVFPWEFKGVLCAQSGMTMVHPSYRGMGIFKETLYKTYELAKNEGIQYIWGVPNNLSRPMFEKIGWKHYADMNQYQWDVLTIPVAYLYKNLKFKYRHKDNEYWNYKQLCGASIVNDHILISINDGRMKIGAGFWSARDIFKLQKKCRALGIHHLEWIVQKGRSMDHIIQDWVKGVNNSLEYEPSEELKPSRCKNGLALMWYQFYDNVQPTYGFSGLDYDTF